MAEFKVGDRVKHRARADVGTVRRIGGDPSVVLVAFDDQTPGTYALQCSSRNLTVVTEEPVFGGTLATAHGGPDFAGIASELVLLLKERHEKYGPTNIANAYGGPMNGLLVRMGDKFARLQHGLAEHKDESVDDTLWDIAGYALIALLVRRGEWPGVE